MDSLEPEKIEPGTKQELLSQIGLSIASLSQCLARIHPPESYSGDAREIQKQAISDLLESQNLLIQSFKVVALANWKSPKILN